MFVHNVAVWKHGTVVNIYFLFQHDQSWKRDWRKIMRAAITADGDVRKHRVCREKKKEQSRDIWRNDESQQVSYLKWQSARPVMEHERGGEKKKELC